MAAVALVQNTPKELNPPSVNEMSIENAERLVLLEDLEAQKEQLHQLPPLRREIYLISAKIALVLIHILSCILFHRPPPQHPNWKDTHSLASTFDTDTCKTVLSAYFLTVAALKA